MPVSIFGVQQAKQALADLMKFFETASNCQFASKCFVDRDVVISLVWKHLANVLTRGFLSRS